MQSEMRIAQLVTFLPPHCEIVLLLDFLTCHRRKTTFLPDCTDATHEMSLLFFLRDPHAPEKCPRVDFQIARLPSASIPNVTRRESFCPARPTPRRGALLFLSPSGIFLALIKVRRARQ